MTYHTAYYRPLRWQDSPRHYSSGKVCHWHTNPPSRYRVVERFADEQQFHIISCEAQYRNPLKDEKWVTISRHKNVVLAWRACGRHHSRSN